MKLISADNEQIISKTVLLMNGLGLINISEVMLIKITVVRNKSKQKSADTYLGLEIHTQRIGSSQKETLKTLS